MMLRQALLRSTALISPVGVRGTTPLPPTNALDAWLPWPGLLVFKRPTAKSDALPTA